jgi:hypothetical protein
MPDTYHTAGIRRGPPPQLLRDLGQPLVTVGGDTLADRAAIQGDEPWVDAAAGGVDPDGVAAVAGHPELVACIIFALVGHLAMAQILGSTPNRGPTRPQSCGGLPTGRSAADCRPADRWHLAGRPIRCDRRSRHQRWVFLRTCPGRRLPAPGPGHEPWTGPPKGIWAGAGLRVCWGQAPEQCRSARPRVKSSGPRRVPEPSATRNRCYRHPLPALRGACQLGNARTRTNLRRQSPGTPGGPFGHL